MTTRKEATKREITRFTNEHRRDPKGKHAVRANTMRLMILTVLGASMIAAPTVAQNKPPKRQSFEIIDGKRYRIVLRGDTGYVVNKAAFVMMTPDEVQRRKRAAEQASGCKVADAQIIGTSVFVQLDCSTKTADPEAIQP